MSKRIRILIVGSDKEYSIESYYRAELEKSADINLFNAHGIFLEHYGKNLFSKILHRIGFSNILQRINRDLLKAVDDYHPDIVWIFKGMEIYSRSLIRIKEKGVKLVNYNPDHPFKFDSKGSGNLNILQNIELYDLHFSYSKTIIEDLVAKYQVNASYLPFGYKLSKMNTMKDVVRKVGFIGNPDKERWEIISSLLSEGVEVDVYGIGWNNFNNGGSERLTIHPPVFEERFVEKSQLYALQLNVFRPQNEGSHNMRTFEMPALGCIMLAPDSPEHQSFFKNEVEAFYYSSQEELVELAKRILAFDNETISELRMNAFNRSINSDYSYKAKAAVVMSEFEKLLNSN